MTSSFRIPRLAQTILIVLSCIGSSLAQNPVEVKNTIKEAIPVRDLSAHQAVVYKSDINFSGQGSGSLNQSYSVPARKRLVIEFITYSLRVPPGRACSVLLSTTFNNTPMATRFLPNHRLQAGNTDLISGTQMTKMYVDAGTSVGVQVYADTVQGLNATGEVTFHGYLVDIPLVFAVAQ